VHDYQTVTQGEHILNTLNKELNGDDAKEINLSPIVRGDRQNMLRALQQMEASPAGGNSPSQRPDNVLDTILKTPNGDKLLELLGTTPEEADKFIQDTNAKRVEQLANAKLGSGTADKAPANPTVIAGLKDAVKNLPEKQQETLLPTLNNPKGMTNAQARDAQKQIGSFQKANDAEASRAALAGGNPAEIAKTANNIVSGDVDQIEKVGTTRGDAKIKLTNAIHDEAERRGLDTTKFTQSALDNKANMQQDYHSDKKGSTGAQMASFDAYLGHTGAAVDAMQRLQGKTLGLTGSPWVNEKLSTLAKQVTNDPDFKAYQTSLVPVKHEIENFLAAGYATKTEDAQAMQQVLDQNETPARITAALKQLAETADVRLASMGKTYQNTMDTNYSNLMSADSINTLKRLGIQSKAFAYSQALPRGWQGDKPSKITDPKVAQAFGAAAGRDRQRTIDLAKANGWTF
jgi:hypothetical protein